MRQHQSDQGVAALDSTWSTVVKIATEPAPLAGAPAEEQVVGPNPASDHIANPSWDVVDHWSRSPLGSRTDFAARANYGIGADHRAIDQCPDTRFARFGCARRPWISPGP